MNKAIISEARALAPKIIDALNSLDVVTNEQSSAATLVCGIVLDVLEALENLVDGGSTVSDDAKKAAVDAAAAAAFAAKFKEDL